MINLGVQKCKKCGNGIQRTDGCHHMTCIVCKHQFCNKCNRDYKGLGSVCECGWAHWFNSIDLKCS